MRSQRLCVVCKAPLIGNHHPDKTHPGECRASYYRSKGWRTILNQRTVRDPINRLIDEPTPEEYQMMNRKPPKRGRVKCLGPIEPEHFFESEDVVRIRICPSCRATNKSIHESSQIIVSLG